MLEDLGRGFTLVEVVGGGHDGERIVVTSCDRELGIRSLAWYLEGDEVSAPVKHALRSPDDKANELLESLLSSKQLNQWRKRGRFWVPTPHGSVEMGSLFNLRFSGNASKGEFVLCVVPEGLERRRDLPEADIWINLMLMLRHDPDEFFRVANWRHARETQWQRGRVPLNHRAPDRRSH
jgi:hypothetical protein